MDYLLLEGVKPYDGRYPLDLDAQPLTTREWGWVKRMAKYLPATLEDDAFSDPEFVAVLAIVAMYRAGKLTAREVPDVWERLQDAPFGTTITVESDPVTADEPEDDAGPLPPSSNGSETTSGPSSNPSSGTLPPTPPVSGTPDSATAVSRPETRSVT